MKTRYNSTITKGIPVIILTLGMFASGGFACADGTLDHQLMVAAERGDVRLARSLLGKGAHVNAKDKYGMTALMAASGAGHVEVAQLLIDQDADINATDNFGKTPLMYAASKGLFEVVKLLVENGAGLGGGLVRAMEVAQKNGHAKTVEFLKVRTYAVPQKSWLGQVVSSTPRALGIRVLGSREEVIMLRLGRRTESSRSSGFQVGTTVEVFYRLEAGGKIGRGIKLLTP